MVVVGGGVRSGECGVWRSQKRGEDLWRCKEAYKKIQKRNNVWTENAKNKNDDKAKKKCQWEPPNTTERNHSQHKQNKHLSFFTFPESDIWLVGLDNPLIFFFFISPQNPFLHFPLNPPLPSPLTPLSLSLSYPPSLCVLIIDTASYTTMVSLKNLSLG